MPVVTTLPSHPEHPCPYDVVDCLPHIGPVPCLLPFNDHDRVASGGYGGEPGFLCEPHHPVPPIATTTTVPVVTTLPATTTTVPVPVTRCVIVRRVQICTLPHETTTTVEQTTTTAPPVVTTLPVTSTTEAPTPPTTAPETPCTGLDDCHIVCNDAAGVDDCNICIGNDSCDVIECPVGYEVDAQGDCDIAPAPPIVTTTTVAPETTTTEAPTTTSTEETTTTAVPTPLSVPCHDKSWCHTSS